MNTRYIFNWCIPFPNNMIPRARFDSISRKLMDLGRASLTANLRPDVLPGTPEYWLENYWQAGTTGILVAMGLGLMLMALRTLESRS